jgi:hypothetical protein
MVLNIHLDARGREYRIPLLEKLMSSVSLWSFYKILAEKGVLIQYSEHDLEEDLKA